jgi:hypothetical protein
VGVWVFFVGGTLTIGSWGDFDVRLAMVYLLPAIALHAWGCYLGRGGLAAKGAAWVLVGAMCFSSGVLFRVTVLAMVAFLAALDLALHARTAPASQRPRAPLRARLAAAVILLAALGGVALLWQFTTFEASVRLGAAVALAAALGVAAALRPALRAPQLLLPALGGFYLFFVLVAAPIIPFGPLVAWWLLCGALLLAAIVALRHVSGPEAPWGLTKHEHAVAALPDIALQATARDVERWLARGDGEEALAQRIEAATGKPVRGSSLREALAGMGVEAPQRADREQALRRILEMTE